MKHKDIDNFEWIWSEYDLFSVDAAVNKAIHALSNSFNIESEILGFSDQSIELIEEKVAEIQDDRGSIPPLLFAPLSLYAAEYVRRKVGGRIVMDRNPFDRPGRGRGRGYGPIVVADKSYDCWSQLYSKLFVNNQLSSYTMIVEHMLYTPDLR